MAKKLKFKINLVTLIALALGVLAILAFLLPFAVGEVTILSTTTTAKFSGFALAFGSESVPTSIVAGSITKAGTASAKLTIIVLIAFIVIVLGLLVQLASFCPSKAIVKNIKIINLAAAVLMIAGGILLFFTLGSFFTANEIAVEIQEYYSLGFGAIAGGIVAIISGLAKAFEVFKK